MQITAIETILPQDPLRTMAAPLEHERHAMVDARHLDGQGRDRCRGYRLGARPSACRQRRHQGDARHADRADLHRPRPDRDRPADARAAPETAHLRCWNGSVLYGISGIDIALWDIAGKLAGLPLHRLLGGAARHTLDAYASLMRYSDPDLVAKNAARAVARGYRAIKLHEIDVKQVNGGARGDRRRDFR